MIPPSPPGPIRMQMASRCNRGRSIRYLMLCCQVTGEVTGCQVSCLATFCVEQCLQAHQFPAIDSIDIRLPSSPRNEVASVVFIRAFSPKLSSAAVRSGGEVTELPRTRSQSLLWTT